MGKLGGKALFLASLLLVNPAFGQKSSIKDRMTHDIICATVIVIAGNSVASPQADQMLNEIRDSWRSGTGEMMSQETLARAMLACVESPSSTIGDIFKTLPQGTSQESAQAGPGQSGLGTMPVQSEQRYAGDIVKTDMIKGSSVAK